MRTNMQAADRGDTAFKFFYSNLGDALNWESLRARLRVNVGACHTQMPHNACTQCVDL
jgi:hypothetical protein